MEIVMSKFKVGDGFKVVKNNRNSHGFLIGYSVSLSYDDGSDRVRFIDERGFSYWAYWTDVEPLNNYQTSNRNKLREHIKSLGFSAIDLSVAAGFNKTYFGSETGESRFNSRGDISDDRLLELKLKVFEAKKKLSPKSIGKLTVDLEVKTTFVSDQSKELIEKLPENKPEKLKSKWIVSNKVFFTFVFFFLLLILFIVTGVVKQVF